MLIRIKMIRHEFHGNNIVTLPKQNAAIGSASQDYSIVLDNSNIQIQNIKRISPSFIIGCELLSQLGMDNESILFNPPNFNLTS